MAANYFYNNSAGKEILVFEKSCEYKRPVMIKKIVPLLLFSTILVQSCSVAKISSLPQSSNEIDFAKYSVELNKSKQAFWTSKTSNEYYIEKNTVYSEADILRIITYAVEINNYTIAKYSKIEKVVFAKRGMRANEWKSIAGIFYQIDENERKTKIYIQVKITQDITGGWRENRAQKIGVLIEEKLAAMGGM